MSEPSEGRRRLTARVLGRVQGVGFRAFVQREARRLVLSGYVRNCPDGSVEAVAEGPARALTELHTSLRRGPSGSQVDRVEGTFSEASGEYQGFGIRY